MTRKGTEMAAQYRRVCVGLAGVVVLVLAGGPTRAQAQVANPARCEAQKLKKESAYYDCLSRCERLVGRGRITTDDCEQGCQTGFDAAVFRVEQSDPCQPPVEVPTPEPSTEPTPKPTPKPDPMQCEAQLLQIEARDLLCHGRCTARAARNPDYDQAGCQDGCNARCQASTEATLAKAVCGQGRVPAGDMRRGTTD